MFRLLGYLFFAVFAVLIVVFILFSFRKKSILTKNNFVGFGVASVLLYALYMTAAVYGGTKITFFTGFTYIKKVIDTACFAPDMSLIESIGKDISIFYTDFAVAASLLIFTTVSSAVTLFGSSVTNRFLCAGILKSPCDVVVGYSPDSLKYAAKNKNCILFCQDISKDAYNDVKMKKIPVLRKQFSSVFSGKKCIGAEHHFIVFDDSGTDITALAKQVSALAEKSPARQYLHIEASEEQVAAIRRAVPGDGSNLSVVPIDKAELVSKKFMLNHPLSLSLSECGYLNENGSVKSGKRINVVFIGFGNISRRLFTTLSVQYQFASVADGRLVSEPVHYYLLDSDKKRAVCSEISRIGYEFDNIVSDGDFGSADRICVVERPEQTIDVCSAEAMKLFDRLTGEDSYTEFIVSLTQTYSDFAYAGHLADYLGNRAYRIFVRNPDGIPYPESPGSRIRSFGETEELFAHAVIVDDSIRILSQAANSSYLSLSGKTNADARRWEELPVIERKSNVSAALSISFKLGLLGCSLKKGSGMTKDEYAFHYVKNTAAGYSRYFGQSADNVLAFCEHARWNAFYILEGYKPLRKEEFAIGKDETGKVTSVRHKNTGEKKHACITSYYDLDGLIRYKYRLFTGKDASADGETDELFTELAGIYNYDYMIMDHLYDNLTEIGYGIR